jgi:hypothetical protein
MSYRPPFFILFFEQKTKLFQAARRTAAISHQVWPAPHLPPRNEWPTCSCLSLPNNLFILVSNKD